MKIEDNSLGFCKLTFYDHFVISVIKEGTVMCNNLNSKQTEVILKYYENQPFVYISHRLHSYSVDPLMYNSSSKIDNLFGFCVVTENYFSRKSTEIEQVFLKKTFKVCSSIFEAKNWAALTYKTYIENK